ncbi:hypothetical protein GGR02_001400 [Anoxybacillus voinovskiensis]|uniref:Fibronectin type-III domain-containing protein n=1 Tax=Anoxybacteroides voinovskiense TaxID=230470 RepID=A0A840DUD8_9BACL|nr:fibronectin type III domain-containing protein [Anoxybacillus voinovskiensis]MBB4073638.1 hypothetical protein [Anoxybacillus voinovskiensis]GGJ63393.1 hypothetical protein GCM10008982_10760 [Anoxybacillus voinovskiensis]
MTVYPADKKGNIVNLSNPVRARYVAVEGSAYNQTYQVQEFDVFGKQIDKTPPSEIKNVSVYTTTDSAILTWENPSDEDFDGVKLYIDGVFQSSVSKQYRTYTFSNLQPNREYEIKIKTYDTAGNESNGVTITVKTLPPPDVTELKLFPSAYSILAQWINPTDSGFIGNDLYLDGNFITSLDKNATSYTFTNLNPNTSYEVKIVSKYNGGYSSSGQTATAKTTIPTEDVTDLQADAKYDRVKLSWTSPESEFFHHVKIYRKKIEQQSFWDQLFGATAVSAATTSDGYTPMFETNGTYWTDLTVTPDTTYSYKVTSVNTAGNESQGVTIETTTPSEPVPVLTGVATTQNENGDYVVTWTSPTKGTVKVLINGQEYTVVDAATQKVIIPKKDMKLNFFGGYDAKLVPIGEFGTEGKAVQVPTVGETKIDFPFSFNDFIQTVINILAWAAPLILLSFVLVFWRPLVEFIKKMLANAKGGRVKQ